MIPYYSPNITLWDIFKVLLSSNKTSKVEQFFRKETGKKYILLTSSCRSALYLTYKSLPQNGHVLTTPLCCESAIEPIFWSNNKALFADVSTDSLNADYENFPFLEDSALMAVQIVNHACTHGNIEEIRNKIGNNVLVVEDCALSFGANRTENNKYQSDVVCFSFLKNGFGIGGGVLATNSQEIYSKAKQIQEGFKTNSSLLLLFRLFFAYFETKQNRFFGNFIFSFLKRMKTKKKQDVIAKSNMDNHLKQPHFLMTNFFGVRMSKILQLNETRRNKARVFIKKLQEAEINQNYQDVNEDALSFGKIFLFNERLSSKRIIQKLNSIGIQLKHLEQRDDFRVQQRFDLKEIYKDSFVSTVGYLNYKKVHDSLVSLPLFENMTEEEMDTVINHIKNNIE